MSSIFTRLFRSAFKRKNKPFTKPRQKPKSRLALEPLEARITPATFIWDGGGGTDNNWSTGLNWVGNVAPTGVMAANDSLLFPAGPTSLITENDFSIGFFQSISFGGSGYVISSDSEAFTLGSTIIVDPNASNISIGADILLQGGIGTQKTFNVGGGGSLTITGEISFGSPTIAGDGLTKDGLGTVTLAADNSAYTEDITVGAGILRISDSLALGDTATGTTVLANAQLQVLSGTGTINEPLLINGPGVANNGALLNAGGNNVWAGTVTMDSNSTIGANAGSSLNITGVLGDFGAGHNLTKEEPGQVILSSANTYRGRTIVADGVLTIRDPLSLGEGGTTANNTIVNISNAGKEATLQIEALGPGFTVLDELLTLNDDGFGGQGALNNIAGNNTWAADVTLGSPDPNGTDVSIGVAVDTNLTISGVVGNPNGNYQLRKIDLGRLILNNANTYTSNTVVVNGFLNIRDSQALGQGITGSTEVFFGAALELEVDTGFDAHGRDLANDSETGFDGNGLLAGSQLGLVVDERLTLSGTGINDGGALHSVSGVNTWDSFIDMFTFGEVGIGVEPDPDPSNTEIYFERDYSLTVTDLRGGSQSKIVSKFGDGHLIFPNANSYSATTTIEGGWISIQNNQSLGNIGGGSDNSQPPVDVHRGTALHLKPHNPGTNLSVVKNLELAGKGIVHPFPLINEKGALMNLGGDNTIGGLVSGRTSFVRVDGDVGIGVELVGPDTVSELTITAPITPRPVTAQTFNINPAGGNLEDSQILDTGAVSGTLTVTYNMFSAPDQLRVYYPPRGEPGSTLIHDTGVVAGINTIVVPYGPGTSTEIEIVVNEGGTTPGTVWTYTATVVPDASTALAGITKLGSRQLILQNEGTYNGDVNIDEGVVLVQHDAALGLASSGTFDSDLESRSQVYTTSNTHVNRGIAEVQSIDVSNQLGLFRLAYDGEDTVDLDPSDSAADVETALNNLTTIANIGGSVTVNKVRDVFTVVFGGSLAGTNALELTAAAFPNVLIDTLVEGDGAALRIGLPRVTNTGGVSAGSNIWHEHLHLQGTGNTLFDVAALTVMGMDNLWQDRVTLTDDASIEVPDSSRLIFRGSIDDGTNPSPSGSTLTFGGGGEIVLANGNTYRGTTIVEEGLLLIQHSNALGTVSSPERQTVTIGGSSTGTFELEFNGALTNAISASALPATVKAELDALPTIGGVGGEVNVTLAGNVYTISFEGSLSGFDQPLLVVMNEVGSPMATVDPVRDGSGGTIVVDGAALQIQGNLAIGNESLQLEGEGVNSTTDVPLGWFNIGPSPVNQWPGPDFQAVSGRITGSVVDPNDPDVIYITTAGGGAWRTTNGGQTWSPLFDQRLGRSETQQFTVTGTSGTFTVTFNGQTTDPLPFDVSADRLREALNSLESIGGASGGVVVMKNANVYQITFAGALSNLDVPAVSTSGSGGATVSITTTPSQGLSNDKAMFVGAIAIDPSNSRRIYIGTGEANLNGTRPSDSYYGSGVYRSIDSGNTWTLVDHLGTGNHPFAGSSITKIIVDPFDSNRIFVASSDQGVNGTPGNAGVWRHEFNQWFNLTSVVSANRAAVASGQNSPPNSPAPTPNPPNSPGPDDNYLIEFPETNATWSDIALIYTRRDNPNNVNNPNTPPNVQPVLYAALGSAEGSRDNGVFWTKNPESLAPIWYVGNPGGTINTPATAPTGVDARSGNQFPTGHPDLPTNLDELPSNSTIKVAAIPGTRLNNSTVYATVAYGFDEDTAANSNGVLRAVYKSTDGGHNWSALTSPDFMNSAGDYANALVAQDANILYVAGYSDNNTNQILRSIDGGGSWTDISVDINGVGPHTAFHGLTVVNGLLYASTDGGFWRFDPAGAGTWTNLTGNLTVAQINGVASHPEDLTTVYAGIQANGVAQFSDSLAWTSIDGEGGGQVRVDPDNPNIIHHVQISQTANATVRRSTDGGNSWITVFNAGRTDVPLELDAANSARLLVGGSGLFHSNDSGASYNPLSNPGIATVSAIGLASYQGTFVPDPSFALVGDQGANTYVPETIYVTDGSIVRLTKNEGLNWTTRTNGLLGLDSIEDIIVDPRNRDTAYLVRSAFGGPKIFETTNAGQDWDDITFDLPDVPVWSVVLDPRTNDLYIGTDIGVYHLALGSGTWRRFGVGMPYVQVRDLELNQVSNTLLAGTYGRGVFQMLLDNTQDAPGALRAYSGTSTWAGPIILVGDTSMSVDGTQVLDVGVSAAQLNLLGTISDAVPNGDYTLTKIGDGDLIFSGANIYGGLTDVTEGVLGVQNRKALGEDDSVAAGTVVQDGAVLELLSDLDLEPIELNGNGQTFNDRATGSLRNFAGNNTYSGPLTLATDATIGVDSGSSLTITGVVGETGGARNLTKELTGTLILANANTYTGDTLVQLGALRVMDNFALGSDAGDTIVFDGAQLQLSGNVTVINEDLFVSGTGIQNSGAILNFGGDNTWQGPVTFDYIPNVFPDTTPPNFVSIGSRTGTSLTIDGVIDEDTSDVGAPSSFGLTVTRGPLPNTSEFLEGRVILTQDNTYNGVTTVNGGILTVRHASALGSPGAAPNNGTIVNVNGSLELDHGTGINITDEEIRLAGVGPGAIGALRNAAGANEISSSIVLNSTASIFAEDGTTMTISAVISEANGGPPPENITKVGLGTVILENTHTYTGVATISAGTLQVDGQIGNVVLNGGTLGGTGTVGAISATGTGGTVNTGASPGILNADSAVWNSATTFFVELENDTPGSGYDQLQVAGTIDLGNATLEGFVGAGVNLGDTFTIITHALNGRTGTFDGLADGDKFAFGGRIAQINYETTFVEITIVQDDTTTLLESSNNPSIFSELVTFTATVNSVIPGGVPSGNVEFYVDSSLETTVALVGGVATFDISTLSVGFHDVEAVYLGDGDFVGSTSNTVTQEVTTAGTTTSVTNLPNPSKFGASVTFTATVAPVAPGVGIPTGTVNFYDTLGDANPGNDVILGSDSLDGSGEGTLVVSGFAVGSYDILVEYVGDGNYAASQDIVTQVVEASDTMTTLVSAPDPSVFGEQVTLTATVAAVAPGAGTPTGTVDFFDVTTSTLLSTENLVGGVATFDISTLSVGTHDILATYNPADLNYVTSQDNDDHTVNQASTTTVLGAAPNPSTFGQQVTFTATVTAVSPGAGLPTGTVTFFDVTTSTQLGSPVVLDGLGQATLDISTLSAGSHTIQATYSSDPNFAGSDNTTVHLVNAASTTTMLETSGSPSQPGDLVTFTATVTANSPGMGTPTGSVTFVNTTTVTTLGTEPLVGGVATFDISTLAEGSHNIEATYNPANSNFTTSDDTLTQDVEKAATTTVLASSQNPSVVGDTITITATVSGPGTEVPTGTVSFTGTGAPGSPVPLNVNGEASFTVSTLTFGLHNYTAAYSGDARFDPSSDLTFTQDVRNDSSTTLASSPDPSVFGQNVTFTATVTSSGGPQPTGNVNFVDTSTNTIIGTGTLVGTQASFSTSSLAVGIHNIRADYVGDVNAVPSSSAPVDQDVDPASTTISVVGAPDPSIFGQEVTFTATVTVDAPGAGIPTGTVNFLDGSTIIGSDTLDGSGQATFATSTLTVGAHNITAEYLTDGSFAGSTSTIFVQDVNATPTSTTLGSNNNPSIFAFPVTFTVTVTNVGAGSTANPPTGTVEFKDGATTIGTKTLDGSGQATLTISTLTAGSHNITAEYLGGSGFAPSTSNLVTQMVNKAGTLAGLSTSGNPSDFGDSVTFVASVAAPPSSGGPTGTITFRDGGTILAIVPVVGRLATFTTSDLSIGTHNIVAEYSGDANHLGAVSNTVSQRVIKVVRARLAVAADAGGGPHVRVFDPANGAEVFSFFAYSQTYTGGVRLATGDVNNDGFDDIITGTGPGGGPHVKVFDGRTGAEIRSFYAYDASFTGGLYVAAGDVNGDGFAEIITGADAGGGPHVRITDGQTNHEIGSFFAFGGNFTGGVRVAAGDINADGRDEIIVGAGVGGGPRVRVIDGTRINQVQSNFEISNSALLRDFFAYNPGYTAGIFVSAGDTNGDGSAEITVTGDVTAPVRIFNGNNGALRNEFFPSFSIPPAVAAPNPGTLPKIRSGVVVGRGVSQIVLGQGAEVRVFDGNSLALLDAFFAFDPSFLGGIFIGV